MHSSKFNMFHDCRHKGIAAVTDGVGFTFQSVVQETIDQDRTIWRHSDSGFHIFCHTLIVIDNFHASAAQYIGRADHNRISDSTGDGDGLFYSGGHTGFRHGNFQLVHHLPEQIPVLSQIDHGRRGTQYLYAVFLQLTGKVQRCLSAELSDYAQWFFFLVNAEYIFQGQWFKIQFIRGVIVGRHRFWITVYDNSFKSQFFQCDGSVDTAVIKLDSLTNAVWPAAQDHNLLFVAADRIFVRGIVGGVVVGVVFCSAYMDTLPRFLHTESQTAFPNIRLWNSQDFTQILI